MRVPSATRSLTVAANTASLPIAMEFLETGALEARLPERRIGELALIVEEIFMNVCIHAYEEGGQGTVTLTYAVPAPGELSVEVADQGKEFNPLTAPAPDISLELEDRPIGGLGIYLVKTLAPSATYRRDRGWNRLSLHISADS